MIQELDLSAGSIHPEGPNQMVCRSEKSIHYVAVITSEKPQFEKAVVFLFLPLMV